MGLSTFRIFTLIDFSLVNCSMLWDNAVQIGLSEFKRAALLIFKGSGSNNNISRVRVTNSTGTGLHILETTSNVEIKQSLFAHSATENGSTAGLHIELTDLFFEAFNCSYVIDECTFVGNKESILEQCNNTRELPESEQVVELEYF